MLVVAFLLLVIVTILLFGASRFIGAVGFVLGGIVALLTVLFGFGAIGRMADTDSGDVLMYQCLAILPVAIIASLMGVGTKSTRPSSSAQSFIAPPPVPKTRFHSRSPSREERKRMHSR